MYFSALGVLFNALGIYFKFKQIKDKRLIKTNMVSIVKSDIIVHATMIASMWGNDKIENEDIIEEVKDCDITNFIDNSSFYLDECQNSIQILKKNLIRNKELMIKDLKNEYNKYK